MKKIVILVLIVSLGLTSVMAQTVRGQSLNGSTGLYSIPTGHIGWETGDGVGLDFGYRAIINNDFGTAHVPAVTVSLFKWVEISTAFDIQPDFNYPNNDENNDLLFGFKVKLPVTATAIAIGLSAQLINFSNNEYDYNAYQPYIAITYPGTFFKMPAETTLVFGKTFFSGIKGHKNNSDIDFGMGFDLLLFPDVFGNIVHWIIDFSNFAYSAHAWPNSAPIEYYGPAHYRGILNLGFRIDLGSIPALSKYKFLIDAVFIDLFDDWQRSFAIGAVFGLQL